MYEYLSVSYPQKVDPAITKKVTYFLNHDYASYDIIDLNYLITHMIATYISFWDDDLLR